MKAIELTSPGNFLILEKEIKDLLPESVLVKIHTIGLCGTDFHAFRGKQPFFSYPRILGHELGAEVVKIMPETSEKYNIKIGDKVSIEPYLNCGTCQACLSNRQNCCEQIRVLGVHQDGGMCEYLQVPASKVHVSNKLSFDQLALVETLGIGLHAVKRSQLRQGDTVLIVGAGPIGLGIANFAKSYGAKVCLADFSKSRLDYAEKKGLLDFPYLVNAQIEPEDLKSLLNDKLPDVIFDATGNKNSMANTFNLISHGGKIVFVGLFTGEMEFNDPNFHKRETTLMGSRNSLPEDFEEIIKDMENGKIDSQIWITHHVAFDDLPKEFSSFIDSKDSVIKVIVNV